MSVTRRRVLKGAGGLVAAALPASTAVRGAEQSDSKGAAGAVEARSSGDVTGRLARYMLAARDRDLPAPIVRDAKNRILDTIGAMISGAALPPGVMATRYVRAQGGTPEASVLTTDIRTT
ncbi:MAG TPA: MmgE/PrpD family protein, partial [Vicinamibacterales bacterium]|nr:MmgE/PrpD family protein [Vicinamibacterales bacterium]